MKCAYCNTKISIELPEYILETHVDYNEEVFSFCSIQCLTHWVVRRNWI